MKRLLYVALAVVIAGSSFLIGYWSRGGGTGSGRSSGGRQILYWVDPMNPALKSDRPGIAPCGMPLEPVYADEVQAGGEPSGRLASMPPGTVQITPERQQLIGVRVEPVSVRSLKHTLRLLGRVAADETRVFRLYSVTEGWVREISPATTGSIAQKDEVLAAYYSQEVLGPQQAYIYALDALDRFIASGTATEEQLKINRNNVATTRQALLNLGMNEFQAEEIAKRRKADRHVQIRAPVTGFILARNISMGQRFDRTTELYTIADLSRVWILADVFENDASFIKPGTIARVLVPQMRREYEARVSSVPPQFDAVSRSLKFRLETDNDGLALRPDMFVDVELPITLPPGLVVPSDAVLDSGLKKTVFVDRGAGVFEPRRVETGLRFGDQVEITGGLMPGEMIVVSGNFFVDSESRMKGASAPAPAALARDPVCGMEVDEEKARAEGRVSVYQGKTFFFCAAGCKGSFDRDPKAYVARHSGATAGVEPSAASGGAHD